MRQLQRRGGQPVPDPVCHMPGGVPVHVAPGTAHGPAAHRATGARPRGRRRRRETVPVRPVRPELPLPFRVPQAPRTKPSGPSAGRQAVHVRHMRYAIQVSRPSRVYLQNIFSILILSVVIIAKFIITGTRPPRGGADDRDLCLSRDKIVYNMTVDSVPASQPVSRAVAEIDSTCYFPVNRRRYSSSLSYKPVQYHYILI